MSFFRKIFRLRKIKNEASEQSAPRANFCCDGCQKPILGDNINLRYHCLECNNFDFCTECYGKLPHPHPMVLETELPQAIKERVGACTCVAEGLTLSFQAYQRRPLFGVRDISPDPNKHDFEWVTYGEILSRVRAFGSGLRRFNLEPRNTIGICGNSCFEWFIADFGAIMHSLIVIPIHTTLDEEDTSFILNDGELTTVICSRLLLSKFAAICTAGACPRLRYVIAFDEGAPAERNAYRTAPPMQFPPNVRLLSFSDVERVGREAPVEEERVFASNPQEVFTVIYTSGSTGRPKGVAHSDASWLHHLKATLTSHYDPDVQISFLPLAHSSPRRHVHSAVFRGARVGLYSGDASTVYVDICALRPTVLSSTPRLYQQLFAEFQRELAVETATALAAARQQANGCAQPTNATDTLSTTVDIDEAQIRKQAKQRVIDRFRGILGGRTRAIVTGGAPTSKAVIKFLETVYQCAVYDGYGTTETGGILTDAGMAPYVEYMLVDVPELGYRSTDRPYPRGELCIKSPGMAVGYWKNPTMTYAMMAEAFKDGYFRTGDIVEETPKGVRIIDRKKHIFKMAQGEFVAPERLEAVFLECAFLQQLFIHGDPFKQYLVCVGVPNFDFVREWLKKQSSSAASTPGDLSNAALCQHSELKRAILQDFARIAQQFKVNSYEIPKTIYLHPKSFTVENRCLTPTSKLCRPYLKQHFKEVLQQLYSAADRDDIRNLILDTFGVNAETAVSRQDLASLGADSLSFVKLMNTVRQQLAITVPLEQVVGRNGRAGESVTVEQLVDLIHQQMASQQSPGMAPIFNFENEATRLADHLLTSLPPPIVVDEPTRPDGVLLTGGTGFLGAFILHELLTQTHAHIFCLVRANSKPEGFQRIQQNMQWYNLAWKEDYASRITAVIGDLARPWLGMTEKDFVALAMNISRIYHNGAWVHGLYPYDTLKGANVNGIVEVAKLALTVAPPLRIVHVSTMTVVAANSATSPKEDEPLDPVGVRHLQGYGQSKWVAEKIIRSVANKKGIPLVIVRPGAIGGDSVRGSCQLDDFINRTIRAICQLNAIPKTTGVINLCPVDFVSKVIVYIGERGYRENNCKVFHLVNLHGEVEWKQLGEYFVRCGIAIATVEFKAWKEMLKRAVERGNTAAREGSSAENNPLAPLVSYFSGSQFVGEKRAALRARGVALYDTTNTSRVAAEASLQCPAIDFDIVARYIEFMRKKGALCH